MAFPSNARERPVIGSGTWMDAPEYRHMGPGYYEPPPVFGTFDHPKVSEIQLSNFLIGKCASRRNDERGLTELSKKGMEHIGPGYYDPEGALAELDALHKAEHDHGEDESDSEEAEARKKKLPSYHLGGTTPRFAPHGGCAAPSNPAATMSTNQCPFSYWSVERDQKESWTQGPIIKPLPESDPFHKMHPRAPPPTIGWGSQASRPNTARTYTSYKDQIQKRDDIENKRPMTARQKALNCFKPRDTGKKGATFKFRQIQQECANRSATAPLPSVAGPSSRKVPKPPSAPKPPSWMGGLLQKCEDEYETRTLQRIQRLQARKAKQKAMDERDSARASDGWGLGGKVEVYTRRLDSKTGTMQRKKSAYGQQEEKLSKNSSAKMAKKVPELNLKSVKK